LGTKGRISSSWTRRWIASVIGPAGTGQARPRPPQRWRPRRRAELLQTTSPDALAALAILAILEFFGRTTTVELRRQAADELDTTRAELISSSETESRDRLIRRTGQRPWSAPRTRRRST
jgi:hypothetical protein